MATSNNKINIEINAKDNATNKLKLFGQNLKEIGERVRFIGTGFTAIFTVPVVGGLALLAKTGNDAARQVNELQKQISDAIAEGNTEKVAALNEQMKALPEHVRRSARAWNELQAALKPANDAMTEAKTIMLEALVPLVRELAPLLTDAAIGIKDLAKWFSDLPMGAQKTIVGIVGIGAVIGPVMLIVGQFMGMIGTAAQLLGMAGVGGAAVSGGASLVGGLTAAGTAVTGFGATVAAALPVLGLLAAAIVLLVQVLKDFGPEATTAARKMLLLASLKTGLIDKGKFVELSQYYGLIGHARGGNMLKGRPGIVGERGPEIFNPSMNGTIIPNHQLSAVGGGGVNIYYSPTFSTASPDEVEKFGKVVRQAIRRSP